MGLMVGKFTYRKDTIWQLIIQLLIVLPTGQAISQKILTIDQVQTGASLFVADQSRWKDKRIGCIVHKGSVLDSNLHLIDALRQKGANIVAIFAPEHGFRANADAGEKVENAKDEITGIPIYSLYGARKKPSKKVLADLDLLVFDLQDVGTRFYTYLSTMYYAMQAAAESQIPLIILDRPNPNGFYVDGPILDTTFRSFVGIIPIPVVHGMTLGELALLIAGEGWHGIKPIKLSVIRCEGYSHRHTYSPPIPPSPNLPNLRSILLYPSLCFFEATSCSVGRGTTKQFQIIGHPDLHQFSYQFMPTSRPGASKPKHQNTVCQGIDLSHLPIDFFLLQKEIQWDILWKIYQDWPFDTLVERPDFMNLLMGTSTWREYLYRQSVCAWKASYQEDLDSFLQLRKKYLLYPD